MYKYKMKLLMHPPMRDGFKHYVRYNYYRWARGLKTRKGVYKHSGAKGMDLIRQLISPGCKPAWPKNHKIKRFNNR